MKLKRVIAVALTGILALSNISFGSDEVYGARKPSIEKYASVEEGSSTTLSITDGKYKVKKIKSVKSSDETCVTASAEGNASVLINGIKAGSAKVTTTVNAKEWQTLNNLYQVKSDEFMIYTDNVWDAGSTLFNIYVYSDVGDDKLFTDEDQPTIRKVDGNTITFVSPKDIGLYLNPVEFWAYRGWNGELEKISGRFI